MNRKLYIAPAILALGLVACSSDKSSSSQNANQDVVVHQEEKVALSVVVVDATTGKPIEKAKVAFSGDLSGNMLSTEGSAVTSATLANGAASFYVKDGETGNLTLVASADGFLGSNKVVSIIEGANSVKLALVSTSVEVKGVDVVVEKAAASKTGAVSAKKVVTAEVAGKEDAVAMTIEQGVVLKDASGKAVTGELKVTIAAFTPTEETALAAIPADLAVTTKDGGEAVSVVAAFIDINISNDAGAEVRTLNPAADVVVALDPNAKDPTTGEAFEAGDVLSVWSNSNGVLKYEGTTKVSEEGTVTLSISHLTSYWVSKDVSTCGDNAPYIVFEGSVGADLAVGIAGNGQFTLNTSTSGKDTLILKNFPSTKPGLSIVASLAGSELVNKSESDVACGKELLIPVKMPSKKGTISVVIGEQCENNDKSAVAMPSAPIYFYTKDDVLATIAITDSEGKANVVLPYGTYNYKSQSRTSADLVVEGSVTVDGDKSVNVTFSAKCSDLTGAE